MREVFELVESKNYSPFNPDLKAIRGINGDEYGEFVYDSFDEVVKMLVKETGLVELWKKDQEISTMNLSFNKQDQNLEINLSAENASFRDDEPQRDELAQDLKELFTNLCISQDALYGYSADEDALEVLEALDKPLFDEITHKPSILFWLQYLSDRALHNTDMEIIKKLGGKIEKLSKGVLVSFFDYSWEVDLNKLADINTQFKV
ncbi:MAG TPA: hypothetical protein VK338_06185 [Candidatus Nitrosocosmicus sp.]|nr:hypothetical protein [Candidatus Nitrosocosmicus sp.]